MFDEERRKVLVSYYAEKSFKTFEDAELLAKNESWNSCANRLYYSAFYMVNAILIITLDVRAKTHNGIKFFFHQNFVSTGKVSSELSGHYSYLMKLRADGDYTDLEKLSGEKILPLIPKTKEFIIALQKLVL